MEINSLEWRIILPRTVMENNQLSSGYHHHKSRYASSRYHRLSLLGLIVGAMEIQFRKPSFRYTPGQWIFINVPAVSGWQWHPFTITSSPADPYVSVHVRQVGDFTKRLGQVLGTQAVAAGVESALANGRNMPTLRVDGPFGAPAEDVLDNEIAVLVGAGIGVTPWASVLKHILSQFKSAHPPQRLRRVEFIWYHILSKSC